MLETRLFIFALPIASLIVTVAPRPPDSPELGYALANSNFINYSGPPEPVDNIIKLDILGDNGLKIKPRLDNEPEGELGAAFASVSINEFLEQRGLTEPDTQEPNIQKPGPDLSSEPLLVANLPSAQSMPSSNSSEVLSNSTNPADRIIERQDVPSDLDNSGASMMVADFEKTNKATLHIVGEGETAYSLSRRFCSTPEDIQRRNSLDDSFGIETGQVLTIPKTTC